MEYSCDRCGVKFKQKKYLVQHLKRKMPCIVTENDLEREQLLDMLTYKNGIECEVCNKIYSNKYVLQSHTCKAVSEDSESDNMTKIDKEEIMTELNKYKQEILDLQKDKKELMGMCKELLEIKKGESIKKIDNSIVNDGIINNTTNTNNGIINNVTLNINSFGKENIEYITNNAMKEVYKLIKRRGRGIINFIKDIHVNPEHPENHNIKIENVKRGLLRIFEKDKWHYYTFSEGLDKLYNITEMKLIDLLEEVEEDKLKQYLTDADIEKFNKESETIGWTEVINDIIIKDEDVKIIDKRIIVVPSKELELKQKTKDRKIREKKKEIDTIVIEELKGGTV